MFHFTLFRGEISVFQGFVSNQLVGLIEKLIELLKRLALPGVGRFEVQFLQGQSMWSLFLSFVTIRYAVALVRES